MDRKHPMKEAFRGKAVLGALLVLVLAVGAIAAAVSIDQANQNKQQAVESSKAKVGTHSDTEAVARQNVEITTVDQHKGLGQEKDEEAGNTVTEKQDPREDASPKESLEEENEDEEETTIVSESDGVKSAVEAAIATANLKFNKNSTFLWPVEGQVLIPFSMDTTTYYRTLGEYKCSDAVVLSAAEDMEVKASARGVVSRCGTNEEVGNFVVVNLGDGYEATYGQLKEQKVETGQVFEQGEVIGTIAQPTGYYQLEGPNLYLRLSKDGLGVDPLDYLDYDDVTEDNLFPDE